MAEKKKHKFIKKAALDSVVKGMRDKKPKKSSADKIKSMYGSKKNG